MLTLVTGANKGKYFNFLKQLIDNVSNISITKNITIRIIVYDVGMDDNEIQQLRMMQNITLEHFDFTKYPEHVSLDKYNGNNCTYVWKPIILHDVCEKYGGLVMWMDTRTLYSDFNALIKILENYYIYSPISGGNIKKWTYPSCIEYMNGSKYSNLPPRAGGIIAVNYNIEWVKKLVSEWKDMSLIKECYK